MPRQNFTLAFLPLPSSCGCISKYFRYIHSNTNRNTVQYKDAIDLTKFCYFSITKHFCKSCLPFSFKRGSEWLLCNAIIWAEHLSAIFWILQRLLTDITMHGYAFPTNQSLLLLTNAVQFYCLLWSHQGSYWRASTLDNNSKRRILWTT